MLVARELILHTGAGGPAGLALVRAAIFVRGRKRVREYFLVIQFGNGNAAGSIEQRVTGRVSKTRACREQPIGLDGLSNSKSRW